MKNLIVCISDAATIDPEVGAMLDCQYESNDPVKHQ